MWNSRGCVPTREGGPCCKEQARSPPAGRRAPLQAAAPSPAGPQRDECSTRRPLWGPQTARRQANPAWKIRRWKARRLNEGAASSGGGEGAEGAAGRAGNVSRALRAPSAPAHSPGPPGPRCPWPWSAGGGSGERRAPGLCSFPCRLFLPSRRLAALCLDFLLRKMGPALLGWVGGLNELMDATVSSTWEALDKTSNLWVP